MMEETPQVTTWNTPPVPASGVPYTLWLAPEWYGAEAQAHLTTLGFQFGPSNAAGEASPIHDQVLIEDLHISELIALIAPIHLTCSIAEVRSWYGQLVPLGTLWLVRLHDKEGT